MTVRKNIPKEEIYKLIDDFSSEDPMVLIGLEEKDAETFIEGNIIIELFSSDEIKDFEITDEYDKYEKLVLIKGTSDLSLADIIKTIKLFPSESSIFGIKKDELFSVVFILKDKEEFPEAICEKQEIKIYTPLKDVLVQTIDHINNLCRLEYERNAVEIEKCKLLLNKGEITILASTPFSGKTSFALTLSRTLSIEQKIPVGYISCGKLNTIDIGERLIAQEAGITLSKLNSGMVSIGEIKKIQRAGSILYEAPIFIDQTPNPFFEEMELSIRLMVEKQNVQVVFIDCFNYLQEVVDAEKEMIRFEYNDIFEKIQNMAKSLNIAVVLLMELPESNMREYSTLSDFKKFMFIPRMVDKILILNRIKNINDPDRIGTDISTVISKKGKKSSSRIWFKPSSTAFEFEE